MLQPCKDCKEPFDTEDRELCCYCFKVDGLCLNCLEKHEDACAEALDLTPTPQNPDEPEDPLDAWEESALNRKETLNYDDDRDASGTEGLGDPAGDGGDIGGMANSAL